MVRVLRNRARPAHKKLKRSENVLYLVVLKEHPDVIKVGRTTKWASRRREYDNWNFARGDGVAESAVYFITEEYVNLAMLEKACITGLAAQFPVFNGNEWFKAPLREAQRVVEEVLELAGMTYAP